ncbi:hypothetical protein AB1K83_11640 [Sporosarcina sp. 179-K 3D1 HS]|uniref:hypothetical protein n=1 Tax=Sporosarcina sp. 179-K 3D1 HS TaxID=3232169 RepID=UPI0039A124BE
MSKKLYRYLFMLVIGCALLVVALTVHLPDTLKWVCVGLALILNITSAIAAMRAGLQQMKPNS